MAGRDVGLVIVIAWSPAPVSEDIQAAVAPPFGLAVFCSGLDATRSGFAQMPLPIWPRRARPTSRHVSTLIFEGQIQRWFLHIGLPDERAGFHGGGVLGSRHDGNDFK